jgi:hypothetical protein
MSDNQNPPQPDPALRRLDRLVGTWTMEGNLVGSDEKNIRGHRHSGWQRPYCDEVSARPPPRHGDDPCLPVGRTAQERLGPSGRRRPRMMLRPVGGQARRDAMGERIPTR